ncbi:MAG: fibronectin type III domain-containing protein [Bacteroidota bacterium]
MKRLIPFLMIAFAFTWQASAQLPSYCIPDHPSGCGFGDEIDDFIMLDAGIEHLGTGCSDTYADYTDDSELEGTMEKTETYVFEAVHNVGSQYVNIWIDLDQDGTFDDDELLFTSATGNDLTTGSIVIPDDALEGETVMRVQTKWLSAADDPCDPTGYGETHDYLVDILPAPDCPRPSSLVADNPSGVSVDVSFNGVDNATEGYIYEVYEEGDDVEVDDPAFTGTIDAGVESYTIDGLDSETTYQVLLISDCGATDGLSLPTSVATFTTLESCVAPNTFETGTITEDSAELTWSSVSNATDGYNWSVYEEGDDPDTDDAVAEGNAPDGTTSVVVDGLSPAMQYEAYIFTDCGDTDGLSETTPAISFSTTCTIFTAPYSEDFDGSTWVSGTNFDNTDFEMDDCWSLDSQSALSWGTRSGGTGSGSTGPAEDVSGDGNYMMLETGPGSDGDEAYLISPAIDLSSLEDPAVTFYYHMYGATINELRLEARVVGDSDWDEMVSIAGQQQSDSDEAWKDQIVDMAAYADETIELRFVGVKGSSFTGDIGLDEVSVDEAPSCFNATGLEIASESGNTADFAWDDVPGAVDGFTWELYLEEDDPETDTPEQSGTVDAGETSVTIDNLNGNTGYTFILISDCGTEDGLSDPGASFTFTTGCLPEVAPTVVEDFSDADFNLNNNEDMLCWSEATGEMPFDGTDFSPTEANAGWTNQNYGNDASNPNGTAFYINLFNGTGSYDWFLSQQVDLGDGSTEFMLEFDRFVIPWSGSDEVTDMGDHEVHVLISTDGGSTWNSDDTLISYEGDEAPGIDNTEFVSLDGYSGVVQFAFYAKQDGTDPDLRFYFDNIRVIDTPDCAYVQGVQVDDTSSDSVDFSWDDQDDAVDGFEWYVVEEGDDPSLAVPVATGTTDAGVTSATADGLTAFTQYDVYVVGDCGADGLSPFYEPTFFITDCDVFDAPLDENFDDTNIWVSGTDFDNTDFEMSPCWDLDSQSALSWGTRSGGTGSGSTGPAEDVSGDGNYMLLETGPGSDGDEAYLLSPVINLDPLEEPSVSFYYHMYGATTNQLRLEVRETGDTDWDEVFEISGEQQSSSDDNWEEVVLDLEAYDGLEVEFRFVGVKGSSFTGDMGVDNFLVDEAPSCFNVAGLNVEPGVDTADLTWNDNSASEGFIIEVYEEGDDPEVDDPFSTDVVDAGETSFTVDGLEELTTYFVQIQADCGTEDGLSEFVGTDFTTIVEGAACGAPIVIDETPYSTTDNTDQYGSNYSGAPGEDCGTTLNALNGNDVVYSYTAEANAAITVTLSGITANNTGIFVYESCPDIGEFCYAGDYNDFSAGTDDIVLEEIPVTEGNEYIIVISRNTTFNPTTDYTLEVELITCPEPSDLGIEVINPYEVEFSWTPNGEETEWEVQYGVAGFELDSEEANTVTVSDDPATVIDDLQSSTPYDFYVRAICNEAEDDLSNWASLDNYNTPVQPIEIDEAEQHAEVYCYGNNIFKEWLFLSVAEPMEEIVLEFEDGSIEDDQFSDDIFRIYDGFSEDGELLWDTSVDGTNLEGLTFQAESGAFYMVLESDIVQSCSGGEGELPAPFDFTVTSPTWSTIEFNDNNFSYYPNPVENQLNIQSANEVEQIQVYNMAGQLIKTERPSSLNSSIDLSDLQVGTYLMKVTINGSNETFRVIKK